MRWLGDTLRHSGDHHVDDDGQESGRDRGQQIVLTTVAWHLDELLGDPTGDVNPAHGSRKAETGDDRIERLCLQFLGNKADLGESISGGHFEVILYVRKIFLILEVTLLCERFFCIVVS